MTEDQLQAAVLDLCKYRRCLVHHCRAALDAALSIPAAERRPSLVTATLAQATAWLAVDHVRREQERVAFTQLMATIKTTRSGRSLLTGH